MPTNATPFASLMQEVYSQHDKTEALSFKVLLACYDMEATIDLVWLEGYHKADNKVEMLEALISELSPDYEAIVETATLTKKDLASDPSARMRQVADKESAQAKRKAAQNMMRLVLTALVIMRECTLVSDKYTLNARKRLEFTWKTAAGEVQTFGKPGQTFNDMVAMGNGRVIDKGWKKAPKQKTTNGPAQTLVENGQAKISLANSGSKAFEDSLRAIIVLIEKTELATVSDEAMKAFTDLEKLIIKRIYGDTKGHVDMDMIRDNYTKVA